jgi:hypothetical protein
MFRDVSRKTQREINFSTSARLSEKVYRRLGVISIPFLFINHVFAVVLFSYDERTNSLPPEGLRDY